MTGPIQRFLRSGLAWKLSGLTYPTAVAATNSRVRTLSDYLALTRDRMEQYLEWFPTGGTFLEFGSGLGGNLFAVRTFARRAYGLDVNPFFVRIARSIGRSLGATNVTFHSYDGTNFPQYDSPLDVVFSIGVFERLPHDQVTRYVAGLSNLLKPGGRALLYFLSAEAARTTFVRRLGADAYAYWDRNQVQRLLESAGLELTSVIPFSAFPLTRGSGSLSVADVYVSSRVPR